MAKISLDEMYQRMKDGKISKLRYYLFEKNMTVSELSILTDINKRALDDYVSGKYDFGNIKLRSGLRIAEVLNVDIYDLL